MKRVLFSQVLLLSFLHGTDGFSLPKSMPFHKGAGSLTTTTRIYDSAQGGTTLDNNSQVESASDSVVTNDGTTQTRILGSQELLMLPRQYAPHLEKEEGSNQPFPQMSHVSTILLSNTPSNMDALSQAIDEAMDTHPLLRSYVQGDGEPTQRIDLFQMVREGEPNPCTFVSKKGVFTAKDVLSVVDVPAEGTDDVREVLNNSWQTAFQTNLDGGADWCDVTKGPLWKVELHRVQKDGNKSSGDTPCALVFTFNHAISDQSSANMLADNILSNLAAIESNAKNIKPAIEQSMPIAMEDSVLGMNKRWSDVQTDGLSIDTAKYVAGKAAEGLRSPVILPDDDETDEKEDGSGILGALTIISGKAPGGESNKERKSTVQFRKLSEETTTALLEKCRANGVTISNALSAATALTSSDFINNNFRKEKDGKSEYKERNFKVLQSLDMRRFGAQLDNCDTVSCMAGSHDLMLGPLPDRSGEILKQKSASKSLFWDLAQESKKQTNEFIQTGGPEQATRVFDFAMTIADMNNLIYLSAQSKESQGRAYSAGIVNAGVFERQKSVQREGDDESGTLEKKHGKYEIEGIHFATSHARSGCLYQTSSLTIGGELQFTFHPAMPIVSEETNEDFANSFVELLEIMAGVKERVPSENEEKAPSKPLTSVLPLAAAAYGVVGVASHAGAWSNFFNSVIQMKESIPNEADFWAALNFWIFFAVGHPILQPILWISDVLHGTPGPKIADLVPLPFLLGNLAFIAAISVSKEIRNAVNIFAVSAFITYVGAGLDGKAGLGDFNLALDDSYKGQVYKGCPTYEEVRQPSMDDFDLQKYQGFWYEHKFHDWTQFKEVYETTLDIKLTEDGKGWIDDFAVKGPAPDSAKLSWDKSPVANGAHYFLFGRVDENDAKGVLRESGFGVEFPNYIVDVQKDENGEYKEAIQFQCLERGGVRVFEGINFMSRNPVMSEDEMTAMHKRAEQAGMFPYGASPEQMHTVARRPADAPPLDNAWQNMWKAIGVDKLLELLTESIEDGGR